MMNNGKHVVFQTQISIFDTASITSFYLFLALKLW